MRLSRAGASLATAGLGLAGLGMATANLELILMSGLPLLMLAYAIATRGRVKPLAARTLSTRTPRRADAVEINVRLDLPRGPELVEVHAPLPATWVLDEGSNLHAFTGSGARTLRLRPRALGRGRFVLPPVRAEMIDPSGLLAPHAYDVTSEDVVEVTPRSYAAKPVRGRLRGALALPDFESVRIGVGTSEFRELRDYHWGDPPKAINWKSTARRLSASARHTKDAPRVPLVNEFEHEGRRAVVVLLDGGAALRIGTSLETGIDHGLEAGLAAARFFLSRGTRVGAATFGARAGKLAPPDAGTGQVFAIERALSPAELDREETPIRALERFHRHLAGSKPFVIVVTRVTPSNRDDLVALAARLRAILGTRDRRLPLLVVDVDALPLVPQEHVAVETAVALVAQQDAAARRDVQAAGARLVSWRVGDRDFRLAILGRGRA